MIYRRLVVLPVTATLCIVAVRAAAPLVLPGSSRAAIIAALAGIILAAVWKGEGHTLAVVGAVLALPIAVDITQWPPVASSTHPRVSALLLVVCVVSFSLSALCAWLSLREREPWPVVVLSGLAVLARANISHPYESNFPLFVIGIVAVIVCIYATSLRRLLPALPAIGMGALLVLFCWQLPAIRVALNPGIGNPVASLITSGSSAGGDPQTLALSGPFHPSNELLMAIATDRPDLRPYWQAVVLDRYDGHSWISTDDSQRTAAMSQEISPDILPAPNQIVQANVQVLAPMTDVVSPGMPLRVTMPTTVTYAAGDYQPLEVRPNLPLNPGTSYAVESSLVSDPVVDQSRFGLYLQLPDVPERVLRLAHSLVRGLSDPLSRALALESFLRDSGRFTYDVRTGSPSDHDAVDAFLFTSHRGYCSQFASALAVMAREVRVPARVVSGYDSGTYFHGTYLIRERDAHSWVQVFAPRTGWVTLDPTPGFQSPVASSGIHRPGHPGARVGHSTRPIRKSGLPSFRRRGIYAPRTASGSARSASTHHRVPLGALAGSALLLTLMGSVAYALRPRPIPRLYASAVRGIGAGETPLEYLERRKGTAGEPDDLAFIVQLYLANCYGRAPVSEEARRQAYHAWRRLLWARIRRALPIGMWG